MLQSLVQALSLEQIQALVHDKFPECHDPIEQAKRLLSQAFYFLKMTESHQKKEKEPWHERLAKSFITAIESLLSILGTEGFFAPPRSEKETTCRFQKLVDLSNLLYVISSALVPILGVMLGGVLVSAALFSMIALSLVYPSYQKKSTLLPEVDCWSRRVEESSLPLRYGKRALLDQLMHQLSSSSPYALLFCRSTEEKISLAQALSRHIRSDDASSLHNRQILYLNLADVTCSSGGDEELLHKIEYLNALAGDPPLLILDHINVDSTLFERLRSQLFKNKTPLPLLLLPLLPSQTTHQISFDPFKPLFASDPDEKELLTIMRAYALQTHPEIPLSNEFFLELMRKKPDEPSSLKIEPLTSLNLLSQKFSEMECCETREKRHLEEMKQQRFHLYSTRMCSGTPFGRTLAYPDASLDELEKNIASLEQELQEQDSRYKTLKKLYSQLLKAKRAFYTTVVTLSSLPSPSTACQFELLSCFLIPSLEQKIEALQSR